jgi:succinoglycan biosynthesis transport protein ExoP
VLYRHLTTYRWSIGIVTAVAAASALFFSYRAAPVYEADASVLVEPIVPASEQAAVPPGPNLATEARLASSIPVAERVVSRLGLTESPTELLEHLTVEPVPQTEILLFRYEHGDASGAVRRAEAFAQQYLRSRESQVARDVSIAVEALEENIAAIERELVRLSEQISETPDRSLRSILRSRADLLNTLLVDKRLDALRLQGDLQTGRIVEPAATPTEPVRPDHRVNTLLGVVLGLLLGAGQAMLRGRLNRRIWSVEELESVTGGPLLGAIPPARIWARRRRGVPLISDPRTPRHIVEAFRFLRENVAAALPAEGGTVLLVTSAQPGEGKSLIAANLAVAHARAGKRVILVSGDSRGSGVDALFGVSDRPGLVDVLSGEARTHEVLIPHASGVRVLPHGRRIDAPVEVMSPRSQRLLEDLSKGVDLVIMDTPAMAGSADTVALAPAADGVLLVVDAERADPGPLGTVRRQFDQVGVPLYGSVLNRADLHRLEARSYRHALDTAVSSHPDGVASEVGRLVRGQAR